MFSNLFDKRASGDVEGDTLWSQCLKELQRVNERKNISVQEVDRLAVLVSHQTRGDFKLVIQEVASDGINMFMDDIPF